MKTAVITGATGCIGRSLINVCISHGYEVLAIIHRSSARAEELKNIEHCHVLPLDLDEYDKGIIRAEESETRDSLDVCDSLDVQNNLSGFELFFHLAWIAPSGEGRNNTDIQTSNIQYTLAAVRLAHSLGCSVFIGAGSQAEYGRVSAPIAPDTPTFPENGYGIAKLCAGQMTRILCNQLGMKHIWCRILSVYGPYDGEKTLISTAIRFMLTGSDTEFTPCEQMWDYIYSDDAALAMLTCAQKGTSGNIYIIGSGEARPLKDYINIIAEITDYRGTPGFGRRPYNDKQVMFLQADPSSLCGIGFKPSVNFREGVRRTIMAFVMGSDPITKVLQNTGGNHN